MATRVIGTDDDDPRLPAAVIAATQGDSADDLAAGDTLSHAQFYADIVANALSARLTVLGG